MVGHQWQAVVGVTHRLAFLIREETGVGIAVVSCELQPFYRARHDVQLSSLAVGMTSVGGDIAYSSNGRGNLHAAPVDIEQVGTHGKQVVQQVDAGAHLVVPAILRIIRTLVDGRERFIKATRLVATCYRHIVEIILCGMILQGELWRYLRKILAAFERLARSRWLTEVCQRKNANRKACYLLVVVLSLSMLVVETDAGRGRKTLPDIVGALVV